MSLVQISRLSSRFSYNLEKNSLQHLIKQALILCHTLVNITQLLSAKDQIFYTDLRSKDDNECGRIIILAQFLETSNQKVDLGITAHELTLGRRCCFQLQPHSPFIRFYRKTENQFRVLVNQSSSIDYPRRNNWTNVQVNLNQLCQNDYNKDFIIELLEQNEREIHIGETELSLNYIRNLVNSPQFQVLSSQSNQSTGKLKFTCCEIQEGYSFDDYIAGGLELKLMIAIDFTESNNDPTNPTSLHYYNFDKSQLSEYERALINVAEILMAYDPQQEVPMYGFGMVCIEKNRSIVQDDKTQHCYPLNHNQGNPVGLAGIYTAYREFVRNKNIIFSGPTLFVPILKKAIEKAQQFQNQNSYLILTILTDGMIQDYDGAFKLIVDCCELPISLIIIGIGSADFREMEKLNNNDLKEKDHNNRKATRDLVQFVAFNKYQQDPKRLAQDVLKELPDQVVDYMKLVGQKPKERKQFNFDTFQKFQGRERYYTPSSKQRQNTFKKILNISDINDESSLVHSQIISNREFQRMQSYKEADQEQLLTNQIKIQPKQQVPYMEQGKK